MELDTVVSDPVCNQSHSVKFRVSRDGLIFFTIYRRQYDSDDCRQGHWIRGLLSRTMIEQRIGRHGGEAAYVAHNIV